MSFAPAPIYPGRRYVGLVSFSGDPPWVETYRGAEAAGALCPRHDLVGIACARFAWGTRSNATLVLAASILAHAFGDGFDGARACALAPLFMSEVLFPLRAFAPWVIDYRSIELWVAGAEDEIDVEVNR